MENILIENKLDKKAKRIFLGIIIGGLFLSFLLLFLGITIGYDKEIEDLTYEYNRRNSHLTLEEFIDRKFSSREIFMEDLSGLFFIGVFFLLLLYFLFFIG